MARRLAAIMAADIVGYSSQMAADEAGTLTLLQRHRAEVFNPIAARFGGRIVKLMGDGTLVEFPSVVAAVECAVEIQRAVDAAGGPIRLRIGINLGDIIIDDHDDVYGDGVNVAARLEALAEPGGVCISDLVYQSAGNRLGVRFVSMGEQHLKNLSRPIQTWHWSVSAETDVTEAKASHPAVPGKPSIAVLPFANMSGDAGQEYFSDGITEDINTELARYDELLVISRNSTAPYKGAAPDARRVAKELGVRHILTGSVRRSANRVRITAQLIDAQTGSHIWADRFDRDMEDIFAVQDEITAVIVNTLLGKLRSKEYERSLHRRPETLDAYDHALRAFVLLTNWDREDTARARGEAERAISLEPGFARAHALLAWAYSLEAVLRWTDNPAASFKAGHDAAIRAVELDYDEPWAHAALGFSELWGRREYEHGIASLRHAVDLNPNNAHFRVWLSNALCLAGKSDEGLAEIETAMRINPKYPPLYLHFHARILATMRRYAEALPHLERLVKIMPTSTNSLALFAACNVAAGRMDKAREAIAHLLRVSPSFSLGSVPEASPYALKEDLAAYVDLLREAGLPE